MTFTILHNKNCSKSRACIQILENENVDFKIRDYIKNPLSFDEVKHLIQNLLGNKFDILRNKTEKIVVKIGTVKPRAVVSAKLILLKP